MKSAAALLLESRIGEHFDAIVTGASADGPWVRLLQPPIEGKLVSGFKGMESAIGSALSYCARTWSAAISTLGK